MHMGTLCAKCPSFCQSEMVDILKSGCSSWRRWCFHDDVMKWKHFPRYWPFVRGIHRSPGNSPHKGQWRGAVMLSLICAWTNSWASNRDAGGFKHHRAHDEVTVMFPTVRLECPLGRTQQEEFTPTLFQKNGLVTKRQLQERRDAPSPLHRHEQ